MEFYNGTCSQLIIIIDISEFDTNGVKKSLDGAQV